MQHQIMGTTLQTLEMVLQPGEMVFSQTHQMAWMTDGITMDTNTGGGMLKGLLRSMSGGSLFVTHFTAQSGSPALVAFCPRFPGTIIARQLAPGETLVCRKETFLCAEASVQLDIFFRQQIGSGIFGGEGFILQKVTGPGWFFSICREKSWTRRSSRANGFRYMSAMSGCRTRPYSSASRGSRASAMSSSAATGCFWRL